MHTGYSTGHDEHSDCSGDEHVPCAETVRRDAHGDAAHAPCDANDGDGVEREGGVDVVLDCVLLNVVLCVKLCEFRPLGLAKMTYGGTTERAW